MGEGEQGRGKGRRSHCLPLVTVLMIDGLNASPENKTHGCIPSNRAPPSRNDSTNLTNLIPEADMVPEADMQSTSRSTHNQRATRPDMCGGVGHRTRCRDDAMAGGCPGRGSGHRGVNAMMASVSLLRSTVCSRAGRERKEKKRKEKNQNQKQ